jgi:hypothetical protein
MPVDQLTMIAFVVVAFGFFMAVLGLGSWRSKQRSKRERAKARSSSITGGAAALSQVSNAH